MITISSVTLMLVVLCSAIAGVGLSGYLYAGAARVSRRRYSFEPPCDVCGYEGGFLHGTLPSGGCFVCLARDLDAAHSRAAVLLEGAEARSAASHRHREEADARGAESQQLLDEARQVRREADVMREAAAKLLAEAQKAVINGKG